MKIKRSIILVMILWVTFCLLPNKIFANTDYKTIDNIEVIVAKKGKSQSTSLQDEMANPSLSSGGSFGSDQSAPDITSITSGMSGIGSVSTEGSKIAGVINAVISLIQFVGSGVAVIVVTILGVKYMLASSSEKADIKKQAMPIVIGCVVLFAAVNLVAIVADIGNGLNSSAAPATTGNNPGSVVHPNNQGIAPTQ